jgi:hypothetical protein
MDMKIEKRYEKSKSKETRTKVPTSIRCSLAKCNLAGLWLRPAMIVAGGAGAKLPGVRSFRAREPTAGPGSLCASGPRRADLG